MNVVFQTTSKKRNSTAQVAGGSTYTCKLKTGCGVLHPVITLQWDGTSSPTAYNYCTIQEFGRCYWIDEWTYDDRQWTASCSVDTLGTYKTEIGTASKYILRAEDDKDIHVIDTKYPAITPPSTRVYPITLSGWPEHTASAYDDGFFVVGVTGMTSGSVNQGGVTYVQMTAAQFAHVMWLANLNSQNAWSTMASSSDFGTALKLFALKTITTVSNPLDYINSVMWFPFQFGSLYSGSLSIGGLDLNYNCDSVDTELMNFTFTITLDAFSEEFDWEKIEPYVTYRLCIPPFGTFNLDAREVSLNGGIRGFIWVDAISGSATLQVTPLNSGKVLVMASGQVGVSIPLRGSKEDVQQIAQTAASVVGAAAAIESGGIAAAVGAAASGIASAAGKGFVDLISSGCSGGIAAVTDYKALYQTKYHHVDQNPHEFGYPLCDYQILGGHSGYLLCADSEIELTGATPYERDEVGQFLVGGFYYE